MNPFDKRRPARWIVRMSGLSGEWFHVNAAIDRSILDRPTFLMVCRCGLAKAEHIWQMNCNEPPDDNRIYSVVMNRCILKIKTKLFPVYLRFWAGQCEGCRAIYWLAKRDVAFPKLHNLLTKRGCELYYHS